MGRSILSLSQAAGGTPPKRPGGIFFDVHCHAFNLSHAGLLSFLNRFFLNNTLTFEDVLRMRLFRILKKFLKSRENGRRLRLKRIILIGVGVAILCLLGLGLVGLNGLLAAARLPLLGRILIASLAALLIVALLPLILILLIWRKKRALTKGAARVVNLLSLIENDLGRQFLLLELDILRSDERSRGLVARLETRPDSRSLCKSIGEEWRKICRSRFRIGGREYRKVFLTPLMMDFNYKGFIFPRKEYPQIQYRLAPRKSIIDQLIDLQFGIRDYWKRSPFQALEIHPFMGLNTRNYGLGAVGGVRLDPEGWARSRVSLRNRVFYIEDRHLLALVRKPEGGQAKRLLSLAAGAEDRKIILKLIASFDSDFSPKNSLAVMLDKYFRDYQDRYDRIRESFEAFRDGPAPRARLSARTPDKTDTRTIGRGFFAGIKVYPPLGFDPWPDPAEADVLSGPRERSTMRRRYAFERRKVEFLYAFCQKKGIPVTTHCGDSGFQVEDRERSLAFTCPDRWANALHEFPNLKLNFAHFGTQAEAGPRLWMQRIIDLMRDFPNVYADFSYRGVDPGYYDRLAAVLRALPVGQAGIVKTRILFGTDFLINLIDTGSYQDYLGTFVDTKALSPEDKVLFSEINPARFLFGESGGRRIRLRPEK